VSAFIKQKAARLLTEARVWISCGERGIEAVVQGDTGTWNLYRAPDRWRCGCPSRRRCSHVEAVERVTRA
jgi:hypothetical protein